LKKLSIVDGEVFINQALEDGKTVLAEGAQGTMLDVDFGSYPYVTSSNTITAGVCSGLGISPQRIGKVFGIFKAYCTRVGGGPFPTELNDETGETLRAKGQEFGATTGRPRRCGWLDLPALRYAIMLNGVTNLIMMKADVLNEFPAIKVCQNYTLNGEKVVGFPFELADDQLIPGYIELPGWNCSLDSSGEFNTLPLQFRDYVCHLEKETGVNIDILSVGPDRNQTIFKKAL
jgi:adenylosuccinate synthase